MTGAVPTVVYAGFGKLCAGAPDTPTNTMFQLAPVQLPSCELRVKNCCCEPDAIWLSTLVSEMKPPLDQPPSSSTSEPWTCIRRYGDACDTAQRSVPVDGTTCRFSAIRPK